MLYNLLFPYADAFPILNVFKYITFRTGGAILTSLIISFAFGERFIRWLKSQQAEGQPIRTDGPESHLLTKKGTPTMGGGLILLALLISTLLWADMTNQYIWITLGVTLSFGALGAYDDYMKLTKRSSDGISGRMKLLCQLLVSLAATTLITIYAAKDPYTLVLPLIKDYAIHLGWFFFIFAPVVMIGASNAVNLTDGLDGLAIVPVMMTAASLGLIAYLVGHATFSGYLQLHHIAHAGELSVLCGALVGAGLGFLWFNAPPAKVFMGDTGSLAVGGTLGVMSVIIKHELVLAIIGGLFVVEAVSVMIQVGYFKLTRKRIFLMAPIHHHFEKKGWAEATVVVRFWIISAILALIGLSTLKLR